VFDELCSQWILIEVDGEDLVMRCCVLVILVFVESFFYFVLPSVVAFELAIDSSFGVEAIATLAFATTATATNERVEEVDDGRLGI